MHTNGTTRAQKFHRWKDNTCHTFLKVLKVVEIIYQNARVYIKMHAVDGSSHINNEFTCD